MKKAPEVLNSQCTEESITQLNTAQNLQIDCSATDFLLIWSKAYFALLLRKLIERKHCMLKKAPMSTIPVWPHFILKSVDPIQLRKVT